MATSSSKLGALLNKAKMILYIIFLVGIAPFYFYFKMPVINIWFPDFSFSLLIITFSIAAFERTMSRRSTIFFKIMATISVLSFFYILTVSLGSWAGFRSYAYRDLLGPVEEKESGNFSKDVAPVELEKIRIVDQDVAHRLGDKVLGEDPALGSQVNVGTFRLQKVGEDFFWVAPLEHSGFFKWWRNHGGSPAYIKVSATDERDVELVKTKTNGDPIRIKYQAGSYFGSNLYRHAYLSGFWTTGMTDFTFEIDDEGTPYWVISLYNHEVGFSGNNVYAIAVMNAETGEINQYTHEDAPAWVDRIQPKEIIQSQIDSWGEYVNGFWNFSNEGKLTSSEGMTLIYGEDNNSYWYTGLTSVGSDQGTTGFMLVNTRTKQSTWYKQAGATEGAAQQSAEGKVQEKGYESSFPIMYNIGGIPTYVMSLKDRGGLIKMIAMVSVEDYSIVGVGNNLKESLRSYREAYNVSGKKSNDVGVGGLERFTINARVNRINEEVTGGNSYYYFTLDGVNKIFLGSSSISNELPLTQVGDSIQVFYEDGRTEMVDIAGFDNFGIETSYTNTQKIQ